MINITQGRILIKTTDDSIINLSNVLSFQKRSEIEADEEKEILKIRIVTIENQAFEVKVYKDDWEELMHYLF